MTLLAAGRGIGLLIIVVLLPLHLRRLSRGRQRNWCTCNSCYFDNPVGAAAASVIVALLLLLLLRGKGVVAVLAAAATTAAARSEQRPPA